MSEINFYLRAPLNGFLSNFHRCPQIVTSEWGTYQYSTNEHYFHAMKAKTRELHDWMILAPSPYRVMRVGDTLREKEIRDGWDDELRVETMLTGLRAKFKDPHLKNRLLDTGDAILHEDSDTDMFWGKKGEDWLGRLLMQVREEIRNEEDGINGI